MVDLPIYDAMFEWEALPLNTGLLKCVNFIHLDVLCKFCVVC